MPPSTFHRAAEETGVRQAFSDLTVVELPNGVAGAYCAKLFADLGANVIKVEPPGGDRLRRPDPAPPPSSVPEGTFLHLNTNKRSVVIDPGDPAGLARLQRIIGRADLVITGSGPAALTAWGTSWDELHGRHPAVSAVHISGFGATGPYADYKWEDLVVQALSGSLLLQNSDQDPLKFPGRAGLYFVANMAAIGGLAAVLHTRGGGTGCFVDCSAVESLATMPARSTVVLAYAVPRRRAPAAA